MIPPSQIYFIFYNILDPCEEGSCQDCHKPFLYFSHADVLCLPSAVLPAVVLPPHALLHKQSRLLPGPAGEEGLAVMQGDQHW